MTVTEGEPIVATESERPVLNRIEGVLESEQHVPKLIGPHGEEIELPPSLFHVLRQLVATLRRVIVCRLLWLYLMLVFSYLLHFVIHCCDALMQICIVCNGQTTS